MPEEDFAERTCIFCQIVRGESPRYLVYEDDEHLAFLDKYPLNPGHTQLIPKRHYRWMWDMEAQKVGEIFSRAKNIAVALERAFSSEWVIADTGGISVPHAHIHLVPRTEDDGHGEFLDPAISRELTPDEMERIAEQIRRALELS